jgi:hypothetical protein
MGVGDVTHSEEQSEGGMFEQAEHDASKDKASAILLKDV